jgi:hypothetical protein
MESDMRNAVGFMIPLVGLVSWALAQDVPTEWIDPATGHRIIRLTREPGASLYFHQNAYTPDGNRMIISTGGGLSAVNLKTREIEVVAPNVSYSMGLAWAVVYRRTRSLRWTIIAHMLTDLLNLSILAFMNIVVPPSLS